MSRLGWSAQPKKKCATEPDSTYFGKYFKLMAKNRFYQFLFLDYYLINPWFLKKLVGFLKNSSSLIQVHWFKFTENSSLKLFLHSPLNLKNLCQLSSLQHVTKRNSHYDTAEQAYWQWGWWLWCWVPVGGLDAAPHWQQMQGNILCSRLNQIQFLLNNIQFCTMFDVESYPVFVKSYPVLLNHIQFLWYHSKKLLYTHLCHGFGGYQEGLGAYDIIENLRKTCYIPTYIMDLGGYQEGFWLWYHTYYIVSFFLVYSILYSIWYGMSYYIVYDTTACQYIYYMWHRIPQF